MTDQLPTWFVERMGVIAPVGQALIIVVAAWFLQRAMRRVIVRVSELYNLPRELVVGARRVSAFLIYGAALLLGLERLGVSGRALWGIFTGFATVGAVAFFAAWSVLSNIFCAILILMTRPFRLYDYIELLDGGDKPGFKGQVTDINLIYTTLQDVTAPSGQGSALQIPNSLFFQRVVRRWRGNDVPSTWHNTPTT